MLLPIFRRLYNLDPGDVHSRIFCGCGYGSRRTHEHRFRHPGSGDIAGGTKNSRVCCLGIHDPFRVPGCALAQAGQQVGLHERYFTE